MDRGAWRVIQSMGSQRIAHDLMTKQHSIIHTHCTLHLTTRIYLLLIAVSPLKQHLSYPLIPILLKLLVTKTVAEI